MGMSVRAEKVALRERAQAAGLGTGRVAADFARGYGLLDIPDTEHI